MTYFYAGLGIAMMTGIVGIFQISVSLKNQQMIYKPITFYTTLQKENDKKFLNLLADLAPLNITFNDQSICEKITDGITNEENTLNPILSNYIELAQYRLANSVNSTHSKLDNGCTLFNGDHRIILVPNNLNSKYSLYSCIIKEDDKCSFEY